MEQNIAHLSPTCKQTPSEQWVTGDYIPLAIVKGGDWESLEKRLNATFERYEVDGLGTARCAFFKTAGGLQFAVEVLLQAPNGPCISINGLSGQQATQHLESALESMCMQSDELDWVQDCIEFRLHEVWRQDDNGNQFLIATKPCKSDANLLVAELTARGHKQLYWAQPKD